MRHIRVIVGAGVLAFAPVAAQAAIISSLTDNFTPDTIDSTKWTVIDKGLENTSPTTTVADTVTNADQLTISGSTSTNYWAGRTLQSVNTFSSDAATTVLIDRVSVAGTGTAWRSSVWIYDDANHYVHFSHLKNEGGGWSYNSNDVGGTGTLNPVGVGNDIAGLNSLDADNGLVTMKLVFTPSGGAGSGDGSIAMSLIKSGVEIPGTTQTFTNWGADWNLLITGQSRQSGDTVTAVFDNVNVQPVPEPAAVALCVLAGFGAVRRRRGSAR